MTTSETQLYMNSEHHANLQRAKKSFLKKTSPQITTIKNGIILPAHNNPEKLWADGGVLDERLNYVETSGVGDNSYLFGGKYNFDLKKVTTSKEEVIFFGPFIAHWGHFICDLIERLWYIKDNPRKYKIAYCGWNWHQGNGDLSGNYLELLKLLGCKEDQFINIQKPTRFKKIIVPESSFAGGKYYTKEFEAMIDVIVQNALKHNIKSPSKIYLSRTKFSTDKERGEKKLEDAFRVNGYEIMYPESLSVTTQIAHFNQAHEIAMVAGSISHNLMFSRSRHIRAIILNKMSLINNYQLVIDDMTKAKLTYIDTFYSPRQVLFGMGPFLLAPTKHLNHFLKDNHYSTSSAHASLLDFAWYFKKYHDTYKIPANKALLKNQKQYKSIANARSSSNK